VSYIYITVNAVSLSHTVSAKMFLDISRRMDCKSAQMGPCRISFLWQQTTNCIVDMRPWTKFEDEFEPFHDVVDATLLRAGCKPQWLWNLWN